MRNEMDEMRLALRQVLRARQLGEAHNIAHAVLKDWDQSRCVHGEWNPECLRHYGSPSSNEGDGSAG